MTRGRMWRWIRVGGGVMQNNACTSIDVGLKREIRFVFHFDYLWGVMFACTVCHVEEYKQQFMVSRTIVFSYKILMWRSPKKNFNNWCILVIYRACMVINNTITVNSKDCCWNCFCDCMPLSSRHWDHTTNSFSSEHWLRFSQRSTGNNNWLYNVINSYLSNAVNFRHDMFYLLVCVCLPVLNELTISFCWNNFLICKRIFLE